jgi:hypothetical protein
VARQSPGSGRWLLKSQEFIDWKESDGVRKLWLVGERECWTRSGSESKHELTFSSSVGAGKTILA